MKSGLSGTDIPRGRTRLRLVRPLGMSVPDKPLITQAAADIYNFSLAPCGGRLKGKFYCSCFGQLWDAVVLICFLQNFVSFYKIVCWSDPLEIFSRRFSQSALLPEMKTTSRFSTAGMVSMEIMKNWLGSS